MPTRRQVLATGLSCLAASALPVWTLKPPESPSHAQGGEEMRRRPPQVDIARVVGAGDIIIVG